VPLALHTVPRNMNPCQSNRLPFCCLDTKWFHAMHFTKYRNEAAIATNVRCIVAQNGSARVNRGRKHICLLQRCTQKVSCLNNILNFSKMLTLSQSDITFRQVSLYRKSLNVLRTTVSDFKYYHCLKNSCIFSNTLIVSQKHFYSLENLIKW
jgi:hypothetical protein